jgi:hypothetical protein
MDEIITLLKAGGVLALIVLLASMAAAVGLI